MNILITCAGRRNYLINYFKEVLKNKGKVIAIDMSLSASALADADTVYQVPSIYNCEYINTLKNIIKKDHVKAMISLNDIELPILSNHKMELETLGTKVLISDETIIETCYDKWKSYLFFKHNGLYTPKTYLDCNSALASVNSGEITFPLIVKPRWGSASIGIYIVESEEELKLTCQFLKLKLRKTSASNAHTTFDVDKSLIIQEKITGQEYGMDILNDFKGNHYASFVRKKLGMRSGETDRAISVINEEFSKQGRIIGNAMGHVGNMDCDFFVYNEKVYFIEMNPRFGGGYPFSHNAGVNIPGIYVAWLEGDKNIDRFNQYKDSVGFAKYDQMVKLGNYYKED